MDIEELGKKLGITDDESDNKASDEELEDLINLLNSPEEDIINIENDSESLGLSQEELDLLMSQDDNIEINTENNVSEESSEEISKTEEFEVFETSGEELSDDDLLKFAEQTKKHDSDNKKNRIIIISSIILLSLLIIFTIIFFAIAINKVNNLNIQKEIEKDKLASKYNPENKNTIYFDMAKDIDGKTLILEKAHINKLNTTFYFKNKVDLMKYNVVLTDSNENLYPMDLNFTVDNTNEDNSILRFNTIIGNNKDFRLIFENIATGKKAEFKLKFDTNLEEEKIVYLNSKLKNSFNGYNININYAQFSDNSSRIDYTIEPTGEVNHKIYQGRVNKTDYVKLKQDDRYISPIGNKPFITSIDDKIIGRMDFTNIEDKTEDVILEFDEIYKKYDLNKKVSLNDIKNGNISYEFDKYKLFIEGMPKFDNKYVLVLNAKDTTISTENRPSDYDNIETILDVEISAVNSNGVEIIISPTEIKSAKYGTDIIFELDEYQMGILSSISPNNIYVNVKSALLKEDKVIIPLNLSRGMEREIISHQIMEEQILNSFKSRLENRNSVNNIKGFTSDVLSNDVLMKEYTSLPNKKLKSDITIISKNIDEEYLEAIIQEAIQIKDGDNIKVIYMTHKIKANSEKNQWSIYSDEIIK
ncbi:MAG: hypothetical protein KIC92_05715 [Clostridiales bacterium]|nr:hypothetical protein [Clostridiales bacterium]